MKQIFFASICILLLVNGSFSQTYNRMENPNYAKTTFFEDFNTTPLDRAKWDVSAHGFFSGSEHNPNLLIWVDSDATVKVNPNTGSLDLSMLSSPGYTTTDYSPQSNTITANFISGEVFSKDPFYHGVFECNATFANGHGSFPAFWVYSNPDCPNRDGNEIDFVELKIAGGNTDFNYNVFCYKAPCGTGKGLINASAVFPYTGGSHTFRGAWSSSQIEFWKDNMKVGTILNEGQSDYPQYPMQIRLSQQIWNYDNSDTNYGIVTPQTSSFHWVKYKEFFLAPEITLSNNVICSSGTASVDVVSDATNITWALSPTYLFNGATTGSGKIANITASQNYHGKGKITYSFNVASDISVPKETFTAEKEMWINGPDPSDISFDVYNSNGVKATKVGNTFLMCPNTTYHIYVTNSSPFSLSNFTWLVPSAWTKYYTSANMVSVNTNSSPGGQVTVNATSTASDCINTFQILTGYLGSNYSCGSYYMAMTPNPSTDETAITLSADGEKVVDENTQWDLQAFDQMQRVKEKKTKIKGKQAKINTTSWKEGTYIISAIIDGELISEKLLVKHQ